MRNPTQISIRLDLEDELAEQFKTVKNARALKSNTELVRQLIREAYNRLRFTPNETSLLEVSPREVSG